jgi:uncharacterized membrane protein
MSTTTIIIIIAVVALVAVIAARGSRPRVTQIDIRREKDSGDA